MHRGFPARAVQELLHREGLHTKDLDQVVYPFMPWWVEFSRMLGGYLHNLPFTFQSAHSWKEKIQHLKAYGQWCRRSVLEHHYYHQELMSELRSLGLGQKLTRIEHHTSHAAVAYLTSGFEKVLALTLDWYGGGLSGSVNRCTPKGIERLHNYHYPHSLGLFYAQVTQALGFKSSRHEGKIVGLAAHGDPTVLGPSLLKRFSHKEGDFRYHCAMDRQFAQDLAARYPREHVAAGFQYVLEVVVCEVTAYWIQRTALHDIVLAGGVAANVKSNQAIAELDEVRQVFIHPNMGDGGTGVRATLAYLLEGGEVKSKEWKTCDLGPEFSEREMEDALRQEGLTPIRSENMSKDVARLLAEGKVVARFSGAMEYRPRALGNRSILCAATDALINHWLNQRLGRTEFMPFAPVTLFEHSPDRFHRLDKLFVAARFMTITYNCTDLMKKESPAAVHIDGTARPQIIRREENPEYYAILKDYHRLTGIPTLINTSLICMRIRSSALSKTPCRLS